MTSGNGISSATKVLDFSVCISSGAMRAIAGFLVPLTLAPSLALARESACDASIFRLEPAKAEADVRASVESDLSTATQLMMANVSPEGTKPGAVVASPSGKNPGDSPNYWFHWVRDGALVMNSALDILKHNPSSADSIETAIGQWIDFSLFNQTTRTLSSGQGEVKFTVDGLAYMGDWGRPQSDGAALRALTATRFYQLKLAQGRAEGLAAKLYDGKIPADSLIKRDLEYVAHQWRDPSFDLWEERMGLHFYTLMTQRASLREGAALADALGDKGAADFYRVQAHEIEAELGRFWDPAQKSVVATLDLVRGDATQTNLDVAVVLGALHGSGDVDSFGPSDERILASAYKLEQRFKAEYDVNQNPYFSELGTAIGRYPGDHYDGYGTDGKGNPWFLATNAYAELCYRVRTTARLRGELRLTELNMPFFRSLRAFEHSAFPEGPILTAGQPGFEEMMNALDRQGDRFLARTHFHWHLGHMSEQFNRSTGVMQGARDLTWSYASLASATLARAQAAQGAQPAR